MEPVDITGLVIKVSLDDASPMVWRRIHLNNDLTLEEFHQVIQDVMGWECAHLYQFSNRGQAVAEEVYEQLSLGALLREPGDGLEYLYDFGDSWYHTIKLEKMLKNPVEVPKVTTGKGCCPWEDCGGIGMWNYLMHLKRKKVLGEDEIETLEMHGLEPGYDPKPFNKDEINQRLAEFG